MFRGATLALWFLCAACSTGSTAVDITLEVRDGWIREPGVECAGSRPFLYVHRNAPFRVEDGSGEVLTSGVLPSGTGVEALNEDLGVPKVPTFCRFRFSVEVPGPGRYRLVLEQGSPLELSVQGEVRDVTLVIS
ncbi:MAG: hypothetical protein M3135_04085 [Actinomycetota bacterium]|nr:hypothetical protein [Actinomycetota bacterium]